MTDNTADLGRMVLNGLVGLKERKGQLTLVDVGTMVLQMSQQHQTAASESDRFMHEEIARLAAYIDEANREIFAISTNEKSEAALLDASAHLDEVVKATEEASNNIMDAADAVQKLAGEVGGEQGKAIMDATNKIYDACNFQDITGQRINKVIKLLSNLESRISKLNALLSTVSDSSNNVVPLREASEKDLLNGPQLPGQGVTQEDVDKLFASLGGAN